MNETYSLLIRLEGKIVFEGLLSDDLRYFRVLRDDSNYEAMIKQLIYEGYVKVDKIDEEIILMDDESEYLKPIYQHTTIYIDTTDALIEFLHEQGFDCSHQLMESFCEIIADGQDLGFNQNVISPSDRIALIGFAANTYKIANNVPYDPVILEDHGSYKLDVKDAVINIEALTFLENILNGITQNAFDLSAYITDMKYKQVIDHIIEIFKIKNLKILEFNIRNTPKRLEKSIVVYLEQQISLAYNAKIFDCVVDATKAFNDQNNYSFKVYPASGMHIIHTSRELYDLAESNKSRPMRLQGRYKSSITVFVDNIEFQ